MFNNNKINLLKIKNSKKIIFSLILITIIIFCLGINSVYSLSKYGSRGDEVKKIQTKLKNWGYYTGEVDGIYGVNTEKAVKNFQSKNGLKVDGIVGDETLKALGITSQGNSSNGNTSTSTMNNSDLYLLAKLIHAEARGEKYEGKVAVAATVLNRVSSSSFPNTIAGVIYQKGAYTCVDDGQKNLEPNDDAKKAARDAINGWDPTSGCIYYFNPNTATSAWIWSRPQVITIGSHIFCK